MSKIIDVISKVDFNLMHEQRLEIATAIDYIKKHALVGTLDQENSLFDTVDALEGVLNFLDNLSDAAEEDGEFEAPLSDDDSDY